MRSTPSALICVANFSQPVSQADCFKTVDQDTIRAKFPGLFDGKSGSPESAKYYSLSRDEKRVAWRTVTGKWWVYVP